MHNTRNKFISKLAVKVIFPIFLITGFGLGATVFATTLPNSVTQTLDRVVDSMSDSRKNLSSNEQRVKYSQVVDFLTKINSRLNTTQKLVANYISDAFSKKLEAFTHGTEQTQQIPGASTYQVAHVDINKVRQERINWHNEVRSAKGLPAYQRDTQLESTAHNWATVLASRNLIDHSSHKRDLTDKYYDYSKIKQWFANQGVFFNENYGTAFAENVAYQYYSCNKENCTQDLISAIKKGRDFFMSEAGRNGSHYRAIVSNKFNKIGMGIAFVGKRYRIVTHYGVR